MAENFNAVLTWLGTEEKTPGAAAAHVKFLEGVKQERHQIGIPDELTAGGVFIAMYTSPGSPPEGRGCAPDAAQTQPHARECHKADHGEGTPYSLQADLPRRPGGARDGCESCRDRVD